MLHKDSTINDGIHIVHAWEVADAAALAAIVPGASDVGKIARQLDTGKFYILENESPVTWQELGGGSGGAPPVEGWHFFDDPGEPAFENGFVNFDAAGKAGFYKNDDRVYMRGIIKGAVGSHIATLPAGYRPVRDCRFATVCNGAYGSLYVSPAGWFNFESGASNDWGVIDVVSFRVS